MRGVNDIIACEAELLKAQKENNLEKMDILLHNDLLFNGPGGVTVTKEMDLAAYKSGDMRVGDIVSGEQQISMFGDTAVAVFTVEITGSFMNEPMNNKVRFIRIWKNFDGQWKVIGGASSIIE